MIDEQTSSRPSRKGGNATPLPSEISSVAFEGMIANQKLKLQNESTQLAIREKEIHYNVELAKKSMDMDLELEKKVASFSRSCHCPFCFLDTACTWAKNICN